MKAHLSLVLICLLASLSIIIVSASTTPAPNPPAVGVKVGDWIEYNITLTGKGSPPPTHDVVYFRIQIIEVEIAAFSANFTCTYRNGTVGSAVWRYNFSEGIVGGWTIIPANLNPGDQFYDLGMHNHKPVNVTIQSQDDLTVLGATRAITYGNDSLRHKEWDKVTGVMVGSSETYRNVTNKDGWYIEDLTATVTAVATNIWSSQTQNTQTADSDHAVLYATVGVAVAALAAALLVITVLRRKRVARQA